MTVVVLVVNGITIAVHLVDGIIWWSINTILPSVYAVLGIEKICHLHALLQVVLGELQYDVRFLRYSRNHQILHADVVILAVGILGVIDKFSQLHVVLLEQDARVFALAQLPSEHSVHLHTVAMLYVLILQMQLVFHDMAHFYEAPYLIECGNVFGLQSVQAIIE